MPGLIQFPDSDAGGSELPPESKPRAYDANDAGRAEQFVDAHAQVIRYVPEWGKWLIWTGNHWRPDGDGGIVRFATQHAKRLLDEAVKIADHQQRDHAVKDALSRGDLKKIKPMLELARCDARIIVHQDRLDADAMLLGVRNGVVELRTGAFRPGRTDDYITKVAGTDFVAHAECPRWMQFLHETLAANFGLIAYVQKFVGYTLTGLTTEQCFAFLYGSGKNGKSTFIETILALAGDYAQRAPQSLLTAALNGREPTNEIANLVGARLVVTSEIEEGSRFAENRVKDITGSDTLTGRFLYQEPFRFKPVLKLWIYGNHKPEIRGGDEGIWRRIRLVPFTVQVPPERRDGYLGDKLIAELPGILNWALEGVRLFLAEGLEPPLEVAQAVEDYREDEDVLGQFLREETGEDFAGRVSQRAMFSRYKEWAESVGGGRFLLSQRTLSKRLRERGVQESRSGKDRYWRGLRLHDSCE